MRDFFAKAALAILTPRQKSAGPVGAISTGGASGTYDTYKRKREPTPAELMRECRNTAYTCAHINAAACADYGPKLYVSTHPGQPKPKCATKRIANVHTLKRMQFKARTEDVQEVVEHPIIGLLNRANPVHSGYDLLELTTLYQECTGRAYWFIDVDEFEVPMNLWPLIPSLVRPFRAPDSKNIIDYYQYQVDRHTLKLPVERVIDFRYPDIGNPFYGGTGPIRGAYDNIMLDGTFLARKTAIWENAGMPSAVISPKNGISPQERDRLEQDWVRKFNRGGQGQVLVPDDEVEVKLLTQKLGDFANLAESKATKEQIANAFSMPLAYLTSETNLANLEAAERQHATLGIRPRIRRRDNTLNEKLVPLFDPTRRLYLEADDPVLASLDFNLRQEQQDLTTGVRTINEVRNDRGWDPVPWGAEPWLPLIQAQTSFDRRQATIYAPHVGRDKPLQDGEQ